MIITKINGERSVDYWKAGQLSVCVMYWRDTRVEDAQDFYKIISSAVPSGTEMLGRKLEEVSDYCVLLGFPYRLGSWAGLRPPLVKRCQQRGVSMTSRLGLLFPVPYGDIWQDDVELFMEHVRSDSLEIDGWGTFGYPLTVKLEDGVSPFLKTAGDMWNFIS
jgi:hypothetical protein